MKKKMRNKSKYLIAVIVLLTNIIFTNEASFVWAADEMPEIESCRIISPTAYIQGGNEFLGTEDTIGIVVKFDSSVEGISIDSTTTYVEINMSWNSDFPYNSMLRGDSSDKFTDENGIEYIPAANELVFIVSIDGTYSIIDVEGDNLSRIEVVTVRVNDHKYTIDSSLMVEDFVYIDRTSPYVIKCTIIENSEEDKVGLLNNAGENISFQFEEKLTVQVDFIEEVIITNEDAVDLFEIDISVDGTTISTQKATTSSALGYAVDTLLLTYVIDGELDIDAECDVRLRLVHEPNSNMVYIDTVKDIAGNLLRISGNYKVDLGKIDIDAIGPTLKNPDTDIYFSHNGDAMIRILDDKIEMDREKISEQWEVGLYISEEMVDSINIIKNLNYIPYELVQQDEMRTVNMMYYYEFYECYYLTLDFNHKAFDKAEGKDQNWYLYYYIQDKDGNRKYVEVICDMDKQEPQIEVKEDYLKPNHRQIVEFNVTDSNMSYVEFIVENLYGEVIESVSLGVDGEFDYLLLIERQKSEPEFEVPNYMEYYFDWETFKGTIDVIEMVKEHQGNELDTGTYRLRIVAGEFCRNEIDYRESTEIVYFTIDTTGPSIDDIEANTIDDKITSYTIEVSDENGQGNRVELVDNLKLSIEDRPITLYYDFVELGQDKEAYDYEIDIPTTNTTTISQGQIDIPVPYGDLTPGTYILRVKLVDSASNETIGSSMNSFEVENVDMSIVCEEVSNDLKLDLEYTVKNPIIGIQYRVAIDQSDVTQWTSDWEALNHTNGEGSLTIDMNSQIIQGEHQVYIQLRQYVKGSYIESLVYSKIFTYDITKPTAIITYSTLTETNKPVVATLTQINDNYSKEDNILVEIKGIENSEGMKQVTLNDAADSKTFIVTDEAGNSEEFVANAKNIIIDDSLSPATVIYHSLEKTNTETSVHIEVEGMNDESVDAILDMTDVDVTHVEITGTGKDEVKTFIFKEYGTYNFTYYDANGNEGYTIAYITNIDKIMPSGVISYNDTELTNADVIGHLLVDEQVEYTIYNQQGQLISGDQGTRGETIRYRFTENETITIDLEDEAGNTNSYEMEVDWIDKTPPNITISYDKTPTKGDVTVKITADEPIYILTGDQKDTILVSENKPFEFYIQDHAGNRVKVAFDITNIIVTNLEFTNTYSEMEITNQDVIVTVSCEDSITIMNNGGSKEMIFSENGTKYFKIKDIKNNIYYHYVDVSNIDKEAPQLVFDESEFLFTKMGGSVELDTGFTIVDEIDGRITEYTIQHNIDYTVAGLYHADYTFADEANNNVTVRRTVEVLPSDQLNIVIDGMKHTGQSLSVNDYQFSVQLYGTMGEYEFQYKKGICETEKFKTNKQMVSGDYVTTSYGGFITFYVIDQERNWKVVRCYIFK